MKLYWPTFAAMWTDFKHCPRCTYPLVHDASLAVDHCHRCTGTLVSAASIEAHSGPWANPAVWRDKLGHRTNGEQLRCPSCKGEMGGFQVPFAGRSVVVDHCDTCGALWLDEGEGEKLAEIVQNANKAGGLSQQVRNTRSLDYIATGRGAATLTRDAVDDRIPLEELHWRTVEDAQDKMEPRGPGSYVFQLFTGMPIEVYNPTRINPILTQILIGALVFFWVIQFRSIVMLPDEGRLEVFRFLGLTPELFLSGENTWGLFTHMFFHGNVIHLFTNLYFLYIFGDNIEDRVGPFNFLMLFLTAGLVGGITQVLLQGDPTIPVVGASGAIAGLMGAYLMLFPRVKMWMVFFFIRWRVPVVAYLGIWALLNILGWWTGGAYVAWMAHLGGFGTGLLAGWLFRDSPWYRH